MLGQAETPDEKIIDALWLGLTDYDDDVRTACAIALATLGQRNPEVADSVTSKLVQALEDPQFDSVDSVVHRSGHDYAFDSLWILVANKPAEPEG